MIVLNVDNLSLSFGTTVILKDGTLLTVYYQSQNSDSYCSLLYTKWKLV